MPHHMPECSTCVKGINGKVFEPYIHFDKYERLTDSVYGMYDKSTAINANGTSIFTGLGSSPQFNVGTYSFSGSYIATNYMFMEPMPEGDPSIYKDTGPATLVVTDPNAVVNSGPVGGGPGAPAPLIGGGLLSALAALAALALTRLRSRSFLTA